ncbi:hypothetical protein [Xanthomonas campestris]|uniref:hypothetical protein n=1 Tax=Xanthomonas campestris TaxID=339 RepID=UPI002B231CDA|nr:hypothetical protein [Xanthomonas campestris]MEA9657759.1 hypothetical protein [Xanthomonas campestris pv. raphani]
MTETVYRRYTDLPSLVAMLTHGELTLLDPTSWDDKNDSFFLEQYRTKKDLQSLLALCFTTASETYHHWRVFSSGPSGVCVWFTEDGLKSALSKVSGVKMRKIEYLTVKQIRDRKLTVAKLPFVKRYPFKPESEVRVLWESKTQSKASLQIPFDSSAISRISLSPWIHPSLTDSLKALLRGLPECRHYKIYRSTLIGNAEWKRHGRAAI